MKFILIMVYLMSQKAAVIQVEFDSEAACQQASKLIADQIYTNENQRPDANVCAVKQK